MKQRTCVVAVIKKENQILLGKKATNKGPYPNTWHIPGGGVELEKENCEEAIKREVKEETGLEIKNLRKVVWATDIEPNKHGEETYYLFLPYECDYAGGELKASDDLHHCEWVDIDKISDHNINRATRSLLENLKYIQKK